MHKLWAREQLRDRGGSLEPDQLFHLTWMATGDRLKADRARSRRALDLNRQRK
jgi:hypothetical protein